MQNVLREKKYFTLATKQFHYSLSYQYHPLIKLKALQIKQLEDYTMDNLLLLTTDSESRKIIHDLPAN